MTYAKSQFVGADVDGTRAMAARDPEIPTALAVLSSRISSLHNALDSLSSRLSSVTRPSEPSAKIGEARRTLSSPIAQTIDGNTELVEGAEAVVLDLLNRLEI